MTHDHETAGKPVLRVALVGPSTGPDAPGGGEVQLVELARALGRRGLNVHAGWDASAKLEGVDLLHLIGSAASHIPLLERARRSGAAVVLSPVAWFDLASRWHASDGWLDRLRGVAGFVARSMPWRWPDWRSRLYRSVDLLMPNSQAEAWQLQCLFGVAAERMTVVPNAADPGMATAPAELFERHYGLRDFVLYAGRLEPRKNVHGLLRALRDTNLPLVVLGDAVPGKRRYAERLRALAGRQVTFLPRIEHGHPLLASAYAACRCLVLSSWFETPGLVALEAAMSGTPLVLTLRGSAREYFGPLARYVRPDDLAGIRRAVCEAFHQPRSARLAEHVRSFFTWDRAAAVTIDGYRRALRLAGRHAVRVTQGAGSQAARGPHAAPSADAARTTHQPRLDGHG